MNDDPTRSDWVEWQLGKDGLAHAVPVVRLLRGAVYRPPICEALMPMDRERAAHGYHRPCRRCVKATRTGLYPDGRDWKLGEPLLSMMRADGWHLEEVVV